jgi:hypothetical protein
LPFPALRALHEAIRAFGARTYLEVVSLDRESEIASVRAAIEIGVDCLLGGAHVDDALPMLAGAGIRYYPFPGRVTGHPSVLEGDEAEIVASARALAAKPGVDGLDLLAYRSRIDAGGALDDLAGLAAGAGYADQAHLPRESQDLAGLPPAALTRLRRAPAAG